MRKRGELMSTPLMYFLIVIFMAFVLLFGYNSLKDIWRTKDMTQLGTFVLNLEDEVEVLYNLEIGSSKEFVGSGIPGKVEQVCFTDSGLQVTKGIAELKAIDERLSVFLDLNNKYNVYTIPTDAYPNPAPHFFVKYLTIEPDENPLCFEVVKGTLRMVLETKLEGRNVIVIVKRL